MEFLSHSPAETEALGARLAAALRPGDIVAFLGGLGAGKTAFVRGIASQLAPDAEVSSPTFALVNEYSGRLTIQHFDIYRITTMDDLYSSGFFDYLESGCLLAVEWSENIAGALPENTLFVRIRSLGGDGRDITFEGKEAARIEAALL